MLNSPVLFQFHLTWESYQLTRCAFFQACKREMSDIPPCNLRQWYRLGLLINRSGFKVHWEPQKFLIFFLTVYLTLRSFSTRRVSTLKGLEVHFHCKLLFIQIYLALVCPVPKQSCASAQSERK